MKNKQDGGFSLIEVVLAMVILALIVVPTCTSLVLSFRVNAKSEAMLQAQLAVSSAVEQLMAKGITADYVDSLSAGTDGEEIYYTSTEYDGIVFQLKKANGYYEVVVMDDEELVTVATCICDKAPEKSLPEVVAS
jgi:prepilin-type N-terminal cleavage/methylation domain-containing protein